MQNTTYKKRTWTRRLLKLLFGFLVLVAVLLAGGFYAVDFVVDLFWFNALGYGVYFWQRVLYSYTVFVVVTLVVFLFFFFNFRYAIRYSIDRTDRDKSGAGGFADHLPAPFRNPTYWAGIFSLVLSLPLVLPVFRNWELFLFAVFGEHMGTVDPYLGRDVSFYMFRFPVYMLVQRRLLLVLIVLLAGLGVIYAVKNHRLKKPWQAFEGAAKWHLLIVLALLSGAGIWEFLLQRYALLFDTTHQPMFYGPGYVQMNVVLPLIWACLMALGTTALALMVIFIRRKGSKTGLLLVFVFIGILVLRYNDYLPHLVDTYLVKPNELKKEGPYMADHIRATLDAYQLTDVEIRDFNRDRLPVKQDDGLMEDVLRNIPVWDAETLNDVFEQLQELRTYYTFPTVNVGRYDVAGVQQQVFLAPREIEFGNLPGEAINWINQHMTYTHGFGAVMTPASQVGGEPVTWFMHNIPPQSDYGISTAQPRIYYGLGQYTYSIAPNRTGEMDYPKGDKNILADYNGRGGVPVSSLLKKALLAYAFKNKKIFFSTEISDQSRFLFRRNIVERVRHLTPFLMLDDTPYLTVTSDGTYWIMDAYTTSTAYPAAKPQELRGRSFNYIRNSVKIVVDAYHGSIDLYIYDKSDPVIAAYDDIYPGLFKSREELPEALESHVRYPRDFFDLQMQVYAVYHQSEPHVFYQQEDRWTFADAISKNVILPEQPYYVTLDLIESGKMEFLLLHPMFPKKRDNLRAVAVAGCDPENYGKVLIYSFPKGELVYGPAQIDALINQDPEIAEQFTLWDQAGSSVVRGKMLILPVENSILFIQPVYLKATSRVKIPELQRIIMSESEEVVMAESVQKAYAELRGRLDKQKDNGMAVTVEKDHPEKHQPGPSGKTGAQSDPEPGTENGAGKDDGQ